MPNSTPICAVENPPKKQKNGSAALQMGNLTRNDILIHLDISYISWVLRSYCLTLFSALPRRVGRLLSELPLQELMHEATFAWPKSPRCRASSYFGRSRLRFVFLPAPASPIMISLKP